MRTTRAQRRAFDRDEALEVALREFWQYGYETTSIASLTRAMGINPPSLYAAFGDKRQLFSEVVQRYAHTHGSYGTRALAEPTARGAVETLLRLAAAEYTDPTHPPGCLVINGATNCTPAAEDVKAELRAFREGTKHALKEKINADIDAGRLPEGADAGALAMFYAAVIQGMSTQACDGADREDLERVAETALNAWPASAPHETRSTPGTAPH
ncbi:TetR/AcrR family transcriptional regulator [Streptomyces sp. NBC_00358]|jgi:Transcriptional regulator|uniref:TetR/AcrR family transcriptional regulator n=1 Tax=Streptomyces sp. NBC_00358 TaxID=2975725 RepID=UPI002E26732E